MLIHLDLESLWQSQCDHVSVNLYPKIKLLVFLEAQTNQGRMELKSSQCDNRVKNWAIIYNLISM